ncbi:hypothetical protein SAMN05216548_107180 [Faunimonas pinastri]|uniref:Uncharacterized protein n=1 Tax=Faunimonas pinastri TaxID=1855383 RepID=A0A1H9IQE1_9HYPH|nr:hypothetical protein SAMN05216548_107180 [Faunimonas pinastri]
MRAATSALSRRGALLAGPEPLALPPPGVVEAVGPDFAAVVDAAEAAAAFAAPSGFPLSPALVSAARDPAASMTGEAGFDGSLFGLVVEATVEGFVEAFEAALFEVGMFDVAPGTASGPAVPVLAGSAACARSPLVMPPVGALAPPSV